MLFSSKGDCPRETKTIAWIFLAISSLMQCKQKFLHFTQIENSTLFHFCARIANSKSSTLPFFNVFFSYNTFQRKGEDSVELAKDWNKHNFFSYPEMVFLLLHRLSSHLLVLPWLLLLTISYMSIQLDVRKASCFCSILWLQCVSFQKGMLFDVSCLLITQERVADFNQSF